jgi:ribosomal protein L24
MAVTKLHVKKDDLVMIVAGKDKGKSGKQIKSARSL